MNILKVDLTKLSIVDGKLLYDGVRTSFMTSWTQVNSLQTESALSLVIPEDHQLFFDKVNTLLSKFTSSMETRENTVNSPGGVSMVNESNVLCVCMLKSDDTLSYDQVGNKCNFISNVKQLEKCDVRVYFTFSGVKYWCMKCTSGITVFTGMRVNLDMIQYKSSESHGFPGELNPSVFDADDEDVVPPL